MFIQRDKPCKFSSQSSALKGLYSRVNGHEIYHHATTRSRDPRIGTGIDYGRFGLATGG